jgi:hypothetical protein
MPRSETSWLPSVTYCANGHNENVLTGLMEMWDRYGPFFPSYGLFSQSSLRAAALEDLSAAGGGSLWGRHHGQSEVSPRTGVAAPPGRFQ